MSWQRSRRSRDPWGWARTSAVTPPTPAAIEALEPRQLLAAAPTTSTVVCSANPAVFGQRLTLTATVAGAGATPTGTVTFRDGATAIGAATLDWKGAGELVTSALSAATHDITVSYGGDSTHLASTSASLSETVNRAATATGLASSAGPPHAPIVRPDHVVVVVEELRSSNALGDANMPYFNQLAGTGLVYTNSHGLSTIATNGEMDYYALYSGSTQGITDDGPNYSFNAPNLADSLNSTPGLSFAGYVEGLPSDGSQAVLAGDGIHGDIYMRIDNPMAQFTNVGPGKTNADVNKMFSRFPTDYSQLPTVSFVIPNSLHSTLGSNQAPPYAGDPTVYDPLRADADNWLRANIDPYLQWARTHNSLLIVTADHADKKRSYTSGTTTIINGDPSLFVPGTDGNSINHYNVLRTLLDMYGVAPIANTVSAAAVDLNAQGQLSPMPAALSVLAGQPVSFTATVAPIGPGAGAVTGAVQFLLDGADFGSPIALVNGSAGSPTISSLTAANHTITALYSGDGSFADSSAPALTQSVIGATTSTNLTSSASPSDYGQSITFTATVASAAGTPTGTVTFKDGATTLGTAPVDATGQAVFSISTLSVGPHAIAAAYSGDGTFNASTSTAITQSVAMAQTSTAVASSAVSSTWGQSVTFTATISITAPGAGAPAGTVTFMDGANPLGSGAVNNAGQAVFSISALSVGSHTITAVYSGDGSFAASTSLALTQTVSPSASPANDLFANRIAIPSAPATVTGNNDGATIETGEPKHAGWPAGGKSVWWTWTAPVNGRISIDTNGTAFDALLAVYTGTNVTALTPVSNGSSRGFTGFAQVTINVVAGTAYQIAVDGYNGASGNIALHMGALVPAPAVAGLVLINTDTRQPVPGITLSPTGTNALNLATLPAHLSIAANTDPATVGSVQFGYDTNSNFHVESSAPYYLNGDYVPFTFTTGTHTVSATAFTGAGASGAPGAVFSVALVITNNAVNQPPTVNAGSNQTITLPSSATLRGAASDDGLPAGGTLTTTWSKFSGPGTVTFGNVNALNTTASFSKSGSYVLRLTASDGSLSRTSDVTITVKPVPGPTITSLTLINTDTRQVILTLSTTGTNTLNRGSLPAHFSIQANVSGAVGSVKFGYDANASQHLENSAPYFFNGDYVPFTFTAGAHTVSATAFTGANAGGTAGPTLTVNLNVI